MITIFLFLELEGLRDRYERLKKRAAGMQFSTINALERLKTFNRAFAEADAWLTQRIAQVSQIQLDSADAQEILGLKAKVDR